MHRRLWYRNLDVEFVSITQWQPTVQSQISRKLIDVPMENLKPECSNISWHVGLKVKVEVQVYVVATATLVTLSAHMSLLQTI